MRYATRQLWRAPGLTLAASLTLALGIGATVSMAGIVDRLLLRAPAGVDSPERVVRLLFVQPTDAGGPASVGEHASYHTMLELSREVPALASVAAFSSFTLPFGTGAEARRIRATLVSPSFFPLLGVRPVVGRTFGLADGFPSGAAVGGPPLAVVAHHFWKANLGGDTRVIGRTIRIGTLTYTIVGVTPPGFRGAELASPDVWLPMPVTVPAELATVTLGDRSTIWLSLIGRLRAGGSTTELARQASQQATTVWRASNAPPGTREARMQVAAVDLRPGRGPDAPREVRIATWLAGLSTLVLLIACCNVTNLLLARAHARRREIAVRLSLGAGQGRLAQQLFVEGLLLAALGGLGGLVTAAIGGQVIGRLLVADLGTAGGALDGLFHGVVDVRLLVLAMGVVLGTAVLISAAPMLQSTAVDLTNALRTGAAAGGGRSARTRALLVGAQAGLALVLLAVAGLFVNSLLRVEALDLGIDRDHTVAIRFDPDRLQMPAPVADALLDRLAARVRATPGVRRAAFAELDPYRAGRAVAIHTPERNAGEVWGGLGPTDPVPMEAAVDSGFFRTVGSASLRGRDFGAQDVRGAPRVAILNAPLARRLFPDREPLGQCVYLPVRSDEPGTECVTVVGVVEGFWRRAIIDRRQLAVYVPVAQRSVMLSRRPAALYVQSAGDAASIVPSIRAAIATAAPGLPDVRVDVVRDLLEPQLRPWRLAAWTFLAFGGVALLIAATGLYAVVAFTAARRAPEVAIRLALGARRRHVLATVAGGSLCAVGIGLAVGAAAIGVAGRSLGTLLFATSPYDPRVIGGVALVLLLVTVLAVGIPTGRATRQSPASVLRID